MGFPFFMMPSYLVSCLPYAHITAFDHDICVIYAFVCFNFVSLA